MTWAEFRIRQFAYRRMDKYSWIKVREIAYQALVGSHVDPKKLPRNQEAYLPLEGSSKSKKELTDMQLDAIRKAQELYRKQTHIRDGRQ